MKDNKTDQRNQEQTGSASNQPTIQDGNKETSDNKPVEHKEEKNYPSIVVEDEDDTNTPNKITDVPNEDQDDSKEITNKGFDEERITNTPQADETGLNKQEESTKL